jgi:hypothetical protein
MTQEVCAEKWFITSTMEKLVSKVTAEMEI